LTFANVKSGQVMPGP